MAAPDPIRLGSAALTGFVFQSGSSVDTDKYGIQSSSVQALFPAGDSVYNALPAEGVSFSTVFGNNYLPSSFLLDFFEGAPGVQYQDARVAKVTFKFKRIDPLFVNRRTVSVDSVLNYQNNVLAQVILFTNGLAQNNVFGFPDPTATVTYSATTAPAIGGGLAGLYAPPGDSRTIGFPAVPDISIPYTFKVVSGSVISYWDSYSSTFVTFTATADTTFVFAFDFIANPRGWQLTKLKYDPIANRNFFAVEEVWRNFYSFFGVRFISHTP